VMPLPPSVAGGVQLTVACPLPAIAETPIGAPGAVGEAALAATAESGSMTNATITGAIKARLTCAAAETRTALTQNQARFPLP